VNTHKNDEVMKALETKILGKFERTPWPFSLFVKRTLILNEKEIIEKDRMHTI